MYVYELELICKRYALNPFLLESTISLLYQPFDIMKQELENKFRFITAIIKWVFYNIITHYHPQTFY